MKEAPGTERVIGRGHQSNVDTPRGRAFSLVELVIVVVIVGVIAAIAVPRLTRGASRAGESALAGDLRVLREAMALYVAEHDGHPAHERDVADLLTLYSNASGATTATAPDTTNGIVYGPYVRAVPPLPVGSNRGETKFKDGANPGDKDGGGWWYGKTAGEIRANLGSDELDSKGVPFNEY